MREVIKGQPPESITGERRRRTGKCCTTFVKQRWKSSEQRQTLYYQITTIYRTRTLECVLQSLFEDVATLEEWSYRGKFSELLPCVQGRAGEFVYEHARSNFIRLYKLRKLDTSRTIGAKFSNHNQEQVESAEEYAAELKRLYDNVHANRNQDTRREGLLRKFLNVLLVRWNM